MALWDSLGKMASEATAKAVEQAKILAETTRLNSLISDEEKRINDILYQIGKHYYTLHHDDCEDAFSGLFAAIGESEKKIQQYHLQIQDAKGITRCDKCGAEVAKGAAYCSACGAQMPVAEVVDTAENTCRKCGAVVEEGMRFCTVCGNPLMTLELPSTPPEAEEALSSPEDQACTPTVSSQEKKMQSSEKILTCTGCGEKVEPGMRFCTVCGNPIDAAPETALGITPKQRVCSNCGTVLDDNDVFCAECGAAIEK